MAPEEAAALIAKDPQNGAVLFPYLNGEELNSRWDQSPSRWVINFQDWPLELAQRYRDCLEIVTRKVKPDRERNADRGARTYWWRFLRPRPELTQAISGLKRTLVIARVSRTAAFAFVSAPIIPSDATVIFALDTWGSFAVLQSSLHLAWAFTYASSLKGDLRYSPTDVFENFPFPSKLGAIEKIGERYYTHRQGIMAARREGLTKTYNRVHDPNEHAEDIQRLRELRVEMDNAVADAYGWSELSLEHGFHQTAQGLRFTISEEARREVLGRLLALNHERYAEEVAAGLHDGPKSKGKTKAASRNEGTEPSKPVRRGRPPSPQAALL
jgi:hypothetical protein